MPDWKRQQRVFQRHRVQGLAWYALKQSGAPIDSADAGIISAAAERIAQYNLRCAAECLRLQNALASREVPFLFVKGVSLGQLAYGSILPKAGWDIDLLIDPTALACAAEVLVEAGYACVLPQAGGNSARLIAWHQLSKESIWKHRDSGIHIELHTALADHPGLIPTLDVWSPSQEVAITQGQGLRTLADDQLFAYLTVHGASSAWFRLKWIADFAALLDVADAAEVERRYRQAVELGAGRAPGLALLLCRWLFGTPMPDRLLHDLLSDRTQRYLFKLSKDNLAGRTMVNELRDVRFGTAAIHATQFFLKPGLSFKAAHLRLYVHMLRRRWF